MKYCKNCGTELGDSALFCTNCGQKLGDGDRIEIQPAEINNIPSEPICDTPLGTLSLILAFFFPLIGLILGIVGSKKNLSASEKKNCKIGIWISSIIIGLGIFVFIIYMILIAGLLSTPTSSAINCIVNLIN